MLQHKRINIKGKLIDLSSPKIMGVINVTPDSFYSGSRVQNLGGIIDAAGTMLNDGATFLDIGGYSSRPGAADISVEQEIERISEPIHAIAKNFPDAIISVDTFRARVAEEAVKVGAHIVNDISGGHLDDNMLKTVGDLNTPYIAMHMRGNPQNMKQLTGYDDLLKEITSYFSERIHLAEKFGIKDVLIDPGFGFAKDIEENFKLLSHVDYLRHLERPIVIGLSRKSMIYRTLNVDAKEALNGTTVLNTVALLKGACILRVHDVKEAAEAIKLVNKLIF